MVKPATTRRREKYLNECDRFTKFIKEKKIYLKDREFLTYRKFLWKKDRIATSQHIIEILLGYFISEYKPKTLVICNHITSKIFRYRAKLLLNHSCSIDSCLEVVSKHELLSNLKLYNTFVWNRIVVFGTCERIPSSQNLIFVAPEETNRVKNTLV